MSIFDSVARSILDALSLSSQSSSSSPSSSSSSSLGGGGILSYAIAHNFTGVQKASFWSTYAWSSVYSQFAVMAILVLVYIVLATFVIVVLFCCCHRRHSPNTKSAPTSTLAGDAPVKFIFHPTSSYHSSNVWPFPHSRTFCIHVISIALLWVCFCALLGTSLYFQEGFLECFASGKNNSLRGTVGRVADVSANFVQQLSLDDLHKVELFVWSLLNTLMDNVALFVKDLLTELFQGLSVNNAIQAAGGLVETLVNVTDVMKQVVRHQDELSDGVAIIWSLFNSTAAKLQKDLNCSLFGNETLLRTCAKLLSNTQSVTLMIDLSKVKVESSRSLLYVLEQYKVNLTSSQAQLQDVDSIIDSTVQTTLGSLMGSLNLSSVNTSLAVGMDNVKQRLQNVSLLVQDVRDSAEVSQLARAVTASSVVLILLPLLMLLVHGLACVFLMVESANHVYTRRKSQRYLAMKRWRQVAMHRIATTQATTKFGNGRGAGNNNVNNNNDNDYGDGDVEDDHSIPNEDNIHLIKMRTFSHRVYYYFSIASVIVALLPLLMGLVLFVFSGLLYNNVCRQLTSDQQIGQVDGQLNAYFSQHWNALLWQLLPNSSSSSSSSRAIVESLQPYLRLQPPKNVVTSIVNNCTAGGGHLLPALGYFSSQSIVNLSQVLQSPLVVNYTQLGRTMMLEQVDDYLVNFTALADLEGLVTTAQYLVSVFIDKVDYNESIQLLNQSLFGRKEQPTAVGVNPMKLIEDLKNFLGNHSQSSSSTNFATLIQRCEFFLEYDSQVKDIEKALQQLQVLYQYLQSKRNATALVLRMDEAVKHVRQLANDTGNVHSLLTTAYNAGMERFKSSTLLSVETHSAELFQSVLQCDFVNSIYVAAIRQPCDSGGFVSAMAAILIQILFTLFIFHLLSAVLAWHLALRNAYKHAHLSNC